MAPTFFHVDGYNSETAIWYIHSHPGEGYDDLSPSWNDNNLTTHFPNVRFKLFVPKLSMDTWNKVNPTQQINYEPSSKYYNLPYRKNE